MKKLLTFATIVVAMVLSSCEFDDSEIWDKLKDHEKRITALEELCKQMNTNITSLQTIVNALEKHDYITNISPIRKDGEDIGYTITFAYSNPITIYHGQDGTDGKDGQDGYTPKIGVKKDSDGIYYWTLDGEWLLDGNGNKVKAVGVDGKDGADGEDGANGQNGVDGITPRLKIENDYWYVSYDDGVTWVELGKATGADGSDGIDGEDGDNIFSSVTQDDEYVYFNLTDGTMITLPKHDKENIQFEDLQVKAICCKNWDTNNDGELSYAEAAAVESIGTVFKDNTNIIAFTELKYFTSISEIPSNAFYNCSSLWKIVIPKSVLEIGQSSFGDCISLVTVNFETEKIINIQGGYSSSSCLGAFANCSALQFITIPYSVQTIGIGAFKSCSNLRKVTFEKNSLLKEIGGGYSGNSYFGAFSDCISLETIEIPAEVETIGIAAFKGCVNLSSVRFASGSKLSTIEGVFDYSQHNYNFSYNHGAFEGCTALLSILIPANVKKIGHVAFSGCEKLSSITFENGSMLETIKGGRYKHNTDWYAGAFMNCVNLTKIELPATILEIGAYAFKGCENLSYVYCKAKIPPTLSEEGYAYGGVGAYPFKDISSSATIYVPRNSYEAYKSQWRNYIVYGYDFEE